MRKMWWLYILGGLVVALGVAFLFGIRGMKETIALQIKDVDISGVADGTYQGRYEAGRFKASVEVTVKDHKIVAIAPLGLDASKSIDKGTLGVFIPDISRIVEKQSPSIDVVSGSTATTKSLLKAVENALVSAGGRPLAK